MSKLLKSFKSLKHSVCNALKPYRVCVIWGGKYIQHKAWNLSDALEWFACYDSSATCVCFNRKIIPVMQRVSGE